MPILLYVNREGVNLIFMVPFSQIINMFSTPLCFKIFFLQFLNDEYNEREKEMKSSLQCLSFSSMNINILNIQLKFHKL